MLKPWGVLTEELRAAIEEIYPSLDSVDMARLAVFVHGCTDVSLPNKFRDFQVGGAKTSSVACPSLVRRLSVACLSLVRRLSVVCRPSFVAPRPSPLAPRPSPLAPRPSPLAPRPSPIAHRPSPIAHRPSSLAHHTQHVFYAGDLRRRVRRQPWRSHSERGQVDEWHPRQYLHVRHDGCVRCRYYSLCSYTKLPNAMSYLFSTSKYWYEWPVRVVFLFRQVCVLVV